MHKYCSFMISLVIFSISYYKHTLLTLSFYPRNLLLLYQSTNDSAKTSLSLSYSGLLLWVYVNKLISHLKNNTY